MPDRKLNNLATLRHAGIDVPDGFVMPVSEYQRHYENGASRQIPPRLNVQVRALPG